MDEVFSPSVKSGLEYAYKLKEAGETALAKKLAVKCVSEAAQENREDILKLFYGGKVYEGIDGAVDAAAYVFAAKCGSVAYATMFAKNPASHPSVPWAKKGNNCDERLKSFFSWLSADGRTPHGRDCVYFKEFISAYSNGATPEYKMSDRVMRLRPLDIVKKIVSGEIEVSWDGELR